MYVLLRLWVQNEPTLTLVNGLPRVSSGDSSSKPLPPRPRDPADEQPEPEAPAQPPSDPFRTHFSPQVSHTTQHPLLSSSHSRLAVCRSVTQSEIMLSIWRRAGRAWSRIIHEEWSACAWVY